MKPIEPGCLAWAAYNGISITVTVISLSNVRDRCWNCNRTDHYWVCRPLPAHVDAICDCVLHRIDGYWETKKTEHAEEIAA